MQSRPADELYRAALQVEVFCQHGFDFGWVRILSHRLVQLDYTAEFVTTSVSGVCQSKLRVVLGRHGSRLRQNATHECEPDLRYNTRYGNRTRRRQKSEPLHISCNLSPCLNSSRIPRLQRKIKAMRLWLVILEMRYTVLGSQLT